MNGYHVNGWLVDGEWIVNVILVQCLGWWGWLEGGPLRMVGWSCFAGWHGMGKGPYFIAERYGFGTKMEPFNGDSTGCALGVIINSRIPDDRRIIRVPLLFLLVADS